MIEQNPYAAPQTDASVTAQRTNFHDIDTKALKKLRNNSHTIRSLGLVNALVCLLVIVIFVVVFPRFENVVVSLIIIGIFMLCAVSVYGLWWRPNWGRTLGFISCTLMLIAFPISTIIGALGLFALAKGGVLFGPHCHQHQALETEWKYRKRNKIP